MPALVTGLQDPPTVRARMCRTRRPSCTTVSLGPVDNQSAVSFSILLVDSYLDEQIVGSELRERLVGLTTTWLLLLVVYVMRGDVIRIVSARMVTKAEREIYENQ